MPCVEIERAMTLRRQSRELRKRRQHLHAEMQDLQASTQEMMRDLHELAERAADAARASSARLGKEPGR